MSQIIRTPFVLILALVLLVGCQNYAEYSLQAYSNATALKAKSLALIEKSGNSYSSQRDDVEVLMIEIDVAYEFAAGFQNNSEVTKTWNLIRSEDENLMGGFVAFWRDDLPGGLSEAFRDNFKQDIAFSFDRLICLEANKGKPTTCN